MASLVIFSIDVSRLADFYQSLLSATSRVESSGDIRLANERDEVLIHSVPKHIARTIDISSPPAPRSDNPIKPIVDVPSLELALAVVRTSGGVVTDVHFSYDGLTRHDVLDPDGNVIQLREQTA